MNIKEQKTIWNNPDNWIDNGHEWSKYYGTTDKLWDVIYSKISKYIKGDALEIAPGFGRITKYLIPEVNSLSIIDLNELCIEKCIDNFGSNIKSYVVNDGKSLCFPDNSFDFIISYDSFVHMTSDVIENYIKEISRTLRKDGYVFIHHSFFFGKDEPSKNIAGRSNMTPDLFKSMVNKFDMEVISQENFRTSDAVNDTITIFRKNKD